MILFCVVAEDMLGEQSTAPSVSPFLPDKLQAYTISGNEGSLRSTLFPFSETAPHDYFLPDVDEEVDEVKRNLFFPPHLASLPVPVKESTREIEGKWFSTTYRLRNPMLQLHKDCCLQD
ncbi:unnamed protein product [Cuscuta epithymum]|uniref:Uncharacterized protein n=1 Tax=Cuscuta epithymum TaxID=186058 RepID=A0AAV0F6A0_9ASTE|nr:unnamed protein product [Cuscuta epithymum]